MTPRNFSEEQIRTVLRRQVERWRLMRTSDPQKSEAQVAAYLEVGHRLLGDTKWAFDEPATAKRRTT